MATGNDKLLRKERFESVIKEVWQRALNKF